ncbi:hypothetical protein PTKIN_Ptkin08bG0201300 [Pterospermum kingtungense]
MELEFQRNKERFAFLKGGSNAFDNMLFVPPGSGIVHQVNLEYVGRVVFNTNGMLYPDSVVGTDSHTTMIDGLGVAGWGVGGIEAEAAMLGQLMSMVLPGVVGFKLLGKLRDGVTATDLVLTVTQMLRKHGVVGKFVEFYGEGMSELSLADSATIANMSPEYGATMGFFPVDHVTLQYLQLTGRSDETIATIESYLRANKMFVDYNEPQIEKEYSSYLDLKLEDVEPCISGPKRPHDRVPLKEMKADWHSCLDNKIGFKGFAIPKESQNKVAKFSFHGTPAELRHGDVVIAAITSCTNTSNPIVMLEAALVAKKACELGLEVGLLSFPSPSILFCIGEQSGYEQLLKLSNATIIHMKGFLILFVVSGLQKYLNKLWFHIVGYGCTTCIGNSGDIDESVASSISENDMVAAAVLSGNRNFEGRVHPLTRANYLASPPLVVAYALAGTVCPHGVKDAYCLLNFGDSITTDHISPAGSIDKDSPAAKYLLEHGVDRRDLNSYGSRHGNDEIMARGTFANIRLVNKLLKGEVGPKTIHVPTGKKLSVYDVAMGVKAVIAKSFERIHRSNLVGMGIIPLCFKPEDDAETLGLTGHERYTIDLPSSASEIRPGQDVSVVTDSGKSFACSIRFDTEAELAYFNHGGILQYVIRNFINSKH